LTGLAWDWEQYGEYLDSIQKLGTAVNVAGLVGHSAIRYYVMGERSVEEQATEAEKQQMADIVATAIDAGAFGFSTNRYEPHKGPDGRSIPGTFADVSELEAIARAVGPKNALVQAVGADFEVLSKIADTENSRVLFSYGTGPDKGNGKMSADALDKLCENRNITAISHVRGSGYMFGLQAGLPFKGEAWRELSSKDFDARLASILDDEFAAKLIEEAKRPKASRVPIKSVFFLGSDERPLYTSTQNLLDQADAAGEHWSETFVRLARETNGRALFNFRMFATNLEEQADLFKSDNVYPGLGDAGAHVSQICDAGWSSFVLSHWHRDTGYFSMGEAIKKMTSGPARVIGLQDRGLIKQGMRADINVFDADVVGECQPELVHDFPQGASRYIQRAKGFKATIVNGQISLIDGELTGTRAGQVLRHGT
jgi:N-acyl-D-amino-acid deacylase